MSHLRAGTSTRECRRVPGPARYVRTAAAQTAACSSQRDCDTRWSTGWTSSTHSRWLSYRQCHLNIWKYKLIFYSFCFLLFVDFRHRAGWQAYGIQTSSQYLVQLNEINYMFIQWLWDHFKNKEYFFNFNLFTKTVFLTLIKTSVWQTGSKFELVIANTWTKLCVL